jgi:hypothetical protein
MITELDPGADPRLAALFAAASAPAEPPFAGEQEALTAYRHWQGRSRFAAFRGPRRSVQIVTAALFGGVLLAGGVATAASGSLPIVGHRQLADATTAPSHVPAAGRPSSPTDASTSTSTSTSTEETTASNDLGDAGPGTAGHPAAHPTLGSVTKGAATCAAASEGRCQAGQHGKALDAHHHARPHATRAAPHRRPGAQHRAASRPHLVLLRGRHGTTHHTG